MRVSQRQIQRPRGGGRGTPRVFRRGQGQTQRPRWARANRDAGSPSAAGPDDAAQAAPSGTTKSVVEYPDRPAPMRHRRKGRGSRVATNPSRDVRGVLVGGRRENPRLLLFESGFRSIGSGGAIRGRPAAVEAAVGVERRGDQRSHVIKHPLRTIFTRMRLPFFLRVVLRRSVSQAARLALSSSDRGRRPGCGSQRLVGSRREPASGRRRASASTASRAVRRAAVTVGQAAGRGRHLAGRASSTEAPGGQKTKRRLPIEHTAVCTPAKHAMACKAQIKYALRAKQRPEGRGSPASNMTEGGGVR